LTSNLFRLLAFVLFLLFLGQHPVWAGRTGARLRVQRTDQQFVEGELIAIRESRLILVDSASRDLAIDIHEVNLIVIDKKAHPWIGAVLGMVLGGIAGVAIAPTKRADEFTDIITLPTEDLLSKMGYGLGGMLAGAVLGGVIGGALGSDSQIVVARMSPAERERLLIKLRSKARIKKAT
jgi:MFS family permease